MWASLVEYLRRRRCSPEVRLAEVGVAKGMKVADIGAGYGFFAFPAAQVVGEGGLVYAIEPDRKRVAEMTKDVLEEGVKNLKVVEATAEDLRAIATADVDIAMSMASFHHFVDQRKGLLEMKRIVKPGGLVYLRDIKPGRVFKHGSRSDEFRKTVLEELPNAEFKEDPHYIVARSRV